MANVAQRSFALGEVSPKLYARTDLQRYQAALRVLRNAVVTKEGGIESRPGLLHKGSTSGDAVCRLLPMVVSSLLPYLLEMGAGYFRFWLNGVLVRFAAPPIAWATATVYAIGDNVSRTGTNYYCYAAHTSGAANAPGTGASYLDFWYVLDADIVEIPNPYLEADLPFVQFADADPGERFFVHPSYLMRELVRVSAEEWTFIPTAFSEADDVDAPTNVQISGDAGSSAADDTRYQVTALIGELESQVSATVQWSRWPGPNTLFNFSPITVTWDAVPGATEYKLYRSIQGQSFLLRAALSSTVLTFTDTEYSAGFSTPYSPPSVATALTDFEVADQYPGVAGMYQQRLILGGQNNRPDKIYASRTDSLRNFFPRNPLTDSDGLAWRQVGSRLNRIQHALEVGGRLVLFSETTEGVAVGDSDGILRPGEVNPRLWSYNGATGRLAPLIVNKTALYVQARGSLVRDLLAAGSDDGEGVDLTVTAAHLTKGYSILAWAYQQTPNSVVWMVRSDGKLLSLTYQRETNVYAWAVHDTDGLFESVAVVPEGDEDAVYVVVRRTINSVPVRYIERFANRHDALADLVLMDAAVTKTLPADIADFTAPGDVTDADAVFAGSGASIVGARLEESGSNSSHGGVYGFVDFVLQRSRYYFEAYAEADERTTLQVIVYLDSLYFTVDFDLVAGAYVVTPSEASTELLYDCAVTMTANGPGFDFTIAVTPGTGYNDAGGLHTWTTVQARAQLLLQAGAVYIGTAGFGIGFVLARNEAVTLYPARWTGFDHLEGKDVSIVVDAVVAASPNNPAFDAQRVVAGSLASPIAGAITHVGLPFTVDVETLDIDTQGSSIKDKGIQMAGLKLWLEDSRGCFAGPKNPDTDAGVVGLEQLVIKNDEGYELDPDEVLTGVGEIILQSTWTKHGRVFIRQVDPSPLAILAIIPEGLIGGRS